MSFGKAKNRKWRLAVIMIAICAIGTGCTGNMEDENTSAGTEAPFGTEAPSDTEVLPDTETDSGLALVETSDPLLSSVVGWYFKKGDFCYRLEVLPGKVPDQQGHIEMAFHARRMDEAGMGWSNSPLPLHTFDVPYTDQTEAYTLQEKEAQGTAAAYEITVEEDGTIALQGSTEAAGVYYPYNGSLMMPEQYQRPLNKTDLIGLKKEELRLLRNEIYAVYGRKFRSQDLQAYFEGKDWYQGTTEPEIFDEAVLSGMMKRNIAFLKTAEDASDEEAAAADARAYAALEPAPYRNLLPEYGEVLVSMSSDGAEITDKGIYYVVKGQISVPITISPEQYEQIETGIPVELIMDELTGETAILKKSSNPQYGAYCLGDETMGNYVEIAYDQMNGNWYLWEDSQDTRFKLVYEGDLYVLKGATEEYYYYFDLMEDSRMEYPGSYRVMDFHESDEWDQIPYFGNILVADSKGYIKALYFRGD